MTRKSKQNKKIVAVDLFCGVGGLTHGLASGGVVVSAGVDVDSACAYPYESNNKSKFIQGDVYKLSASDLRPYLKGAEVTLLAGCAPCQPFSTYSQSGRNGDYNKQWPLLLEFGRLIRELKPNLITMENVPQVSNHEVFKSFLEDLAGYSIWWDIVDCVGLGIPQTRKRLVLIASRYGPLGLSLKMGKPGATVRDVIAGLPAISAGQRHPADPLHGAPSLSPLNLKRIKASRPGGTWRDWPPELQASCHKKYTGATYPSVYGRMEWDKASPTITTQCFGYGNGRFGHPDQDRAISLREAAMIQTFPSGYKFVQEGGAVRFNRLGRLIGNAVPVKLGEAIAEVLQEHVHYYCSKAKALRPKSSGPKAKGLRPKNVN